MAEFLFEIGMEEVPARMIAGARAELQRRVVGMLEREGLISMGPDAEAEVRSFATPRRLAVLVGGVAERQRDVVEEMVGPSVKVGGVDGLRDGEPTAAAMAFARKAGVEVGALKTVATVKGDYLVSTATKAGRSGAEVLAAEMPKELARIAWAKNMYWRTGKPERFVRPVRWLLALLGDEVVPMSFAGRAAGNITYGHRVLHGDGPVVIEQPGEYEAALERAHVIADVENRRERVRKALDQVCRTVEGTRWREDHELVDTVTQLTEWPTVVRGGFEVEFLALPEEVLVTVMRDHQKYFAVERVKRDRREGNGELEAEGSALAPHFLAVLNVEVDERGLAVIRHGNERVLRARFNDARFFWEFDQRMRLEERVAGLEKVTFQRDLGSYAAKKERVRKLCGWLAKIVSEGHGILVDEAGLLRAAELAKTDLTTELVKEFTELQGIVGGLYARAQGENEVVSTAIYDQYKPSGAGDRIPRTVEGQLLSIADKVDLLAGMFKLGLEPTGSKDPFALRRAANGVVQILAESELLFASSKKTESLTNLLRLALAGYSHEDLQGRMPPLGEAALSKLEIFFAERTTFYLREIKGQAYDVVAAVMGAPFEGVPDAVARAEAVTAVRAAGGSGGGDFAAVCVAFKRMKNILTQAREKGIAVPERVDEGLLLEPEETALAERSSDLAGQVEVLRAAGNFRGALTAIAGLRPQVDAFFDAVMVMVQEESVGANRLALLERVLGNFSRIADFSEIVVAG